VKQVNRAVAETVQEAAIEEGLAPLMEWTVSFMNRLIRKGFQVEGYVFAWQDETSLDPLVQAQVDQIYVRAGSGSRTKCALITSGRRIPSSTS
jgi:hypothetical protein